ncbi:MAG: 1-deoxy-D-xylulose-5-phosphate reductoisomerase [Burkholderiales bacterium]|nr:1-deoxy-D-xylulose-5-phosphate reductoisomerase [Burkholderiales bacterium]
MLIAPLNSTRLQRVCVLGSTGSIGSNTLDVITRHPGRFEVFALSGARRVDELLSQCVQWRPSFAVMPDEGAARRLRAAVAQAGLATQVLSGDQALCDIAAHPDVDIVMASIVGAAGLAPCLAAARAGKRLLLANKEALVVGGALFMSAVAEGGATLLPIDSEHSAIFQCLPKDVSTWDERIDHIVLTASGGPFRQRDPATLSAATPDQACAHPNWVMGRKISVDSATMMNKALEVIEARWLFGLSPDRIKVVLHPQSIIHSMVVCRDRSVLAQMGTPDMRVPIAYGLSWPHRIESGADLLDFTRLSALTFEEADAARYPGLQLAWDTLGGPMGSTAVLNAANEIAVDAFLNERIRFDQIHAVNAQSLVDCKVESGCCDSVEGLLELDAQARCVALTIVASLSR